MGISKGYVPKCRDIPNPGRGHLTMVWLDVVKSVRYLTVTQVFLTVIKAVNVTNNLTTLFIINEGKMYIEGWYENLPDDSVITLSDSGYTNKDIRLND